MAEGVRFAAMAARANATAALVIAPKFHGAALEYVDRAGRAGAPILRISDEEFHSLSLLDAPQGIAVVSPIEWSRVPDFATRQPSLWIAFDEVRSAGNLGSALRTAAGAGAAGAIFLSHRADPFDPRAVPASMGALYRMRLVRASGLELARAARSRATFVGSSARGSVDYRRIDYGGHTVLLIGAERGGMSEAQWRLADVCARIPIRSEIGSLNLTAASSVLLYEAVRHRRIDR
jgi:TrmH family RNA methyltransferase